MDSELNRAEAQLLAIVDELRLHRLSKRMRQSDLADQAGVNRTTIADYELRRHRPTLAMVDRIASGLGLQVGVYLEQREVEGED